MGLELMTTTSLTRMMVTTTSPCPRAWYARCHDVQHAHRRQSVVVHDDSTMTPTVFHMDKTINQVITRATVVVCLSPSPYVSSSSLDVLKILLQLLRELEPIRARFRRRRACRWQNLIATTDDGHVEQRIGLRQSVLQGIDFPRVVQRQQVAGQLVARGNGERSPPTPTAAGATKPRRPLGNLDRPRKGPGSKCSLRVAVGNLQCTILTKLVLLWPSEALRQGRGTLIVNMWQKSPHRGECNANGRKHKINYCNLVG